MVGDITPDEKNWTWVLDRRCNDCGFDASVFDSTGTAMALRDQVARWSTVLERTATTFRTPAK